MYFIFINNGWLLTNYNWAIFSISIVEQAQRCSLKRFFQWIRKENICLKKKKTFSSAALDLVYFHRVLVNCVQSTSNHEIMHVICVPPCSINYHHIMHNCLGWLFLSVIHYQHFYNKTLRIGFGNVVHLMTIYIMIFL